MQTGKGHAKVHSQEQKQSSSSVDSTQGNICPQCGASNECGALFCEECGAPLKNEFCPNCGAKLLPGADLCEECGMYLKHTQCSFCGHAMDETDAFCPECGSPQQGIVCPNCQTLSHTSFCTNCNTPLNDIAKQTLQEAQKEPEYQQMVQISEEINELEQQLQLLEDDTDEGFEEAEDVQDAEKPVVKTAKQIEREKKNAELTKLYEQLAHGEQKFTQHETPAPQPVSPPPAPKKTTTSTSKIKRRKESKAELEAIIKKKRKEVQAILNNIAPPENATPPIVRNFYMARKPPISEAVWECNYSHFYHPNPSHCAKPILGGKWVVVDEKIEWEYGIE